MNNYDERDYAEEAANQAEMEREGYNEYLSELSESVTDYFATYRTDPEYIVTVPTDSMKLEILISAVGGGEIGKAYAQNDWIYGIRLNGHLVVSGADLRSALHPATHHEMAQSLAYFMAVQCESEALLPFLDELADFGYTE